jgi:hypothetical protein
MKLLIMLFSPASNYLISLLSKYYCLLLILKKKTLVCVLLLMLEKKFHTHTKLQENIRILCISNFTFLGRRQNKAFLTELLQALPPFNLLLISE